MNCLKIEDHHPFIIRATALAFKEFANFEHFIPQFIEIDSL